MFAVTAVMVGMAQNGYQISGKIDGMSDGILLLMSGESEVRDTLAETNLVNGAFMFSGKVERPVMAYIIPANGEGMIPLVLENTNFMINVGSTAVLVQGGRQQEIYNKFSRNNMELLQGQNRIRQEFRLAEQARDKSRMQELTEKYEKMIIDARQKEEELLKLYSDSYVAAYVVSVGARSLELEPLKARYNLLGEAAKQTVPGRFVASQIEELEQLSVGNEAPDFTVVSQTGDSLSLYPIKSKLKLLVFWDSNNLKCREDNVTFLDIYQKYHLRGLEIVSISREENRQAWLKAINQDGMFWKQGLDANSTVFNRYHVLSIPYTVLLDEENKIIAKNLQGVDLRKKVAELLKRK